KPFMMLSKICLRIVQLTTQQKLAVCQTVVAVIHSLSFHFLTSCVSPISIEVAEQDSVEDLKKAYLSCKSAVESRRIQAIRLLRQGKGHAEVRAITGFHNGPLVEIIKRYNAAELAA
ncbi:MAG: hypothetical protein AAF267_23070, partial [Deinococcota bacterium]